MTVPDAPAGGNAPASTDHNTIVIGASAAGLAVAACLSRRGIDHVVLERADSVGAPWRCRYERLHLHTSRGLSGLPHRRMPRAFPRYPSRDQVVEYLEDYAEHFGIIPEFGVEVESVDRRDGRWVVASADRTWTARHVVVATGYTRVPMIPSWPGEDSFPGAVMHSVDYRNGSDFRGRRVLVVGFGNSAGEIGLDLLEHGAQPMLAVRGPVNVVPRDLLGIPILAWGIAMRPLPSGVADALAKPLLRLSVGDIRKAGLRRLPYGANTEIRKHGQIPLLDIGTMRKVRDGEIAIRPGVARFCAESVVFTDGRSEVVDAVVLATGYRPGLADFVKDTTNVTDEDGKPLTSGREIGQGGLYLCGFHVAATGMLREISKEARQIARTIGAASD